MKHRLVAQKIQSKISQTKEKAGGTLNKNETGSKRDMTLRLVTVQNKPALIESIIHFQ